MQHSSFTPSLMCYIILENLIVSYIESHIAILYFISCICYKDIYGQMEDKDDALKPIHQG